MCTKFEFAITILFLIGSINYVFEGNFVLFLSPGVRKDRVRWYLLINAINKSEAAIALVLQKAHGGGGGCGTGNQGGQIDAPPTCGEDGARKVEELQRHAGERRIKYYRGWMLRLPLSDMRGR
jgi:hypothetical protein